MPGGLSYKREVDHYRSQYSNRAQTDGPATPEDAAAFNCFLHQLVCTQLNVFNDPLVLTNASNTKELWVYFVELGSSHLWPQTTPHSTRPCITFETHRHTPLYSPLSDILDLKEETTGQGET